jgi:serine/threonine protein kinase
LLSTHRAEPVTFKRELVLLTLLSDASEDSRVLRFFGAFQKRAKYYLVTELAECDLQQYLAKNGTLSLPSKIWLMTQVAQAVQRIHHFGIVHRDLKSANFLVFPVARWSWCSDHGEWIPMSEDIANKLEQAKAAGQAVVDHTITSRSVSYRFDIAKMEQTNVVTGFRRKLQRLAFTRIKIADLGLSRTASDHNANSMTFVGGTRIYLDPQILRAGLTSEIFLHHDVRPSTVFFFHSYIYFFLRIP